MSSPSSPLDMPASPVRVCAAGGCTDPLPPGSSANARYCSARCKKRAAYRRRLAEDPQFRTAEIARKAAYRERLNTEINDSVKQSRICGRAGCEAPLPAARVRHGATYCSASCAATVNAARDRSHSKSAYKREHAALSRKLTALRRERKEVSELLGVAATLTDAADDAAMQVSDLLEQRRNRIGELEAELERVMLDAETIARYLHDLASDQKHIIPAWVRRTVAAYMRAEES